MSQDTIVVKSRGLVSQEEAIANSEVSPGQLIEYLSTGKVQPHSTAGGSVSCVMIVIEDKWQGKGMDDAYAAAARVFHHTPQPGDEYQMKLKDGQSAVFGQPCESAGDGDVQNFVEDTWEENIGVDSSANIASGTIYGSQILGIYKTTKDLSDSSAADPADRWVTVKFR